MILQRMVLNDMSVFHDAAANLNDIVVSNVFSIIPQSILYYTPLIERKQQ